MEVKLSYDSYSASKTIWETANTAYDTLRLAYNAELDKERERNADF